MGSEVATLRYYPFDTVAMFITLIIIGCINGHATYIQLVQY